MVRKILAVVAGVVVGAVVVWVVQLLGHRVVPLPAGMDPTNMESVRAHMAEIPAAAFGFVLLGYVLGALVGGYTAARIGRAPRLALAVGAILMVFGILNVVLIPHPLWFTVATFIVFLPAAWLGGRLAGSA
jgi:hypothetical protein